MRIEHVYPKSKTILPQPPVHVKLYFSPKEWGEIREHFLLDEEHNNPEKTVRFGQYSGLALAPNDMRETMGFPRRVEQDDKEH